MDLILIDQNKLKIMLSDSDMKDYSLNCASVDYDDRETRTVFWNILHRAKDETGFDAEGGKIFIQFYPSKEGGCEMYVTKLGLVRNDEHEKKDKKQSSGLRECAYSFDALEKLLAVCRRLSEIGYPEKSAAWRSSDKYYLLLEEPEENAYIPLTECTFIREYGKSESFRSLKMLLAEQGECICAEDAVDILSQF